MRKNIHIVSLDADFRHCESVKSTTKLLESCGLKPSKFVLLVSTIESRKNHITAFDAWLVLIEKFGANETPILVCVGNRGWLNDAVYKKLQSNSILRNSVMMISRISDGDLGELYRNALFTIYPSLYEGWGLPVTESLCYGKVPLISDSSSLPEAGGSFADYFPAGSATALALGAERLIFDADYRTKRENLIKSYFRPRSWSEIGLEIMSAAAALSGEVRDESAQRPVRAVDPMPMRVGVYYPLTRNYELRVWREMVLAEMFRAGSGWWWPDDWGTWTKPGGGEFAMTVGASHGAARLCLRIRGVIDKPCLWSITLSSPIHWSFSGTLGPDEWKWVVIDLPGSSEGSTIRGVLCGDQTQDLAERTGGADPRITSIGLAGLYFGEFSDTAGRLSFVEAISTNNFAPLTPGYAYHRGEELT